MFVFSAYDVCVICTFFFFKWCLKLSNFWFWKGMFEVYVYRKKHCRITMKVSGFDKRQGLIKKGSWSVISNFIMRYGRHLSKSSWDIPRYMIHWRPDKRLVISSRTSLPLLMMFWQCPQESSVLFTGICNQSRLRVLMLQEDKWWEKTEKIIKKSLFSQNMLFRM